MAKKIERLDDLQPDTGNANKGTVRGRGMVEASLREVGAGRSILADREGRIIAGNKTLEAWVDIGGEIEVVRSDGKRLVVVQREDLDLSDDTGAARKMAYLDNRAGEVGLDWDAEQLLADLGAGLDLSSMFREDELDALLADLLPMPEVNDAGPQVDRADELREKWGVQPNQLWALGEHKLVCGDCTDAAVVARLMGGEKADAVLTDPPYGIGFDTDYTKLHGGNFGTQKRNKHAPVQGDDKDFNPAHLLGFKNVVLWGANCYPQHLKAGTFLVWDKRNAAGQTLFSDAEIGWLNRGHGCYIFAHKWDGLNRESERGEHLHPTQKPIALWVWVMTEHVKDVDIVFEPYCGAGGVLLACEQLARRCRAIEISPAYCAVAIDRWATATGKTPVLVE